MRDELKKIIKKDAVFNEQIKLASGKISDFYVDLRKVTLNARGLELIAKLIWPILEKDKITAFGGPTMGADPIVGGICYLSSLNKTPIKGFLVRKEQKQHGRCNSIEGPVLLKRDRIAVVDDVVTSGGSLIKAVLILREAGYKVVKAVSVVDREEGAKEAFDTIDCPLVSLYTKGDFNLK